MKINDMEVHIQRTFYNKTQLQEDGVTQIVHTSKQYPMYQVLIGKNYFDLDKPQMVDNLIKDLQGVVQQLQTIRSKDKQNEEVEL